MRRLVCVVPAISTVPWCLGKRKRERGIAGYSALTAARVHHTLTFNSNIPDPSPLSSRSVRQWRSGQLRNFTPNSFLVALRTRVDGMMMGFSLCPPFFFLFMILTLSPFLLFFYHFFRFLPISLLILRTLVMRNQKVMTLIEPPPPM